MAKAPLPPRSAEQLKEVAIFLKQADKLVRDGDFPAALEQIAKARSRDPRNLYALAYEERVRSLMNAAGGEKKSAGPTLLPLSSPVIPAALEHISNLAIVEAHRSANVAVQQEEELKLRKKEEEDRKKNEELRRIAIESKIRSFLDRAQDYLEQREFNRALDETTRAYLLDPASEDIHEFEEKIRQAKEFADLREAEEQLRKQLDEEQKRQEMLRAHTLRMQQEKEEKRKREEEARQHARQQKIRQYIVRAQELFSTGHLDDALSELTFVVVIDPLNEEVLNLERQIRDKQETLQVQQLEALHRREEEHRKKQEAIRTAIRKHIEHADRLAGEEKFSEALRIITRAYVLEPANEDLQSCEQRIVAAQEKAIRRVERERLLAVESVRRQQEEELRTFQQAEHERALVGESAETEAKRRADNERVLQYLTTSRTYLNDQRYEDALGEVALAFIVNPFDEEVKRVEIEILEAQRAHKASEAATVERADAQDQSKGDAAAMIASHLAEAARLAASQDFSKALDEVAKAFILDPLNASIQQYEDALQLQSRQHQEEVRRTHEADVRRNAIDGHIRRAEDLLDREAFVEALGEVANGLAHDTNNPALLSLEGRIKTGYELWHQHRALQETSAAVQDRVFHAREFLAKGFAHEALTEVIKALVIDPTNAELKALKQEVEIAHRSSERRKALDEKNKRIQSHIFRAKEYIIHESFDDAFVEITTAFTLDPDHTGLRALKKQADRSFEQFKAKRVERELRETLNRHIRLAREHLANNVYDEALVEVALGLTIDPTNEPLVKLEEEIIHAGTELVPGAAASGGLHLVGDELSPSERDRLVRFHLQAADELHEQKEFSKALDELAKAYVIDPLSKDVKRAELRIRQDEIRHTQQAGQPLKLIYPNEKAAGGL